MNEAHPKERPARSQILDLACQVGLYRVLGSPTFDDLVVRARDVAHAAALEGVPLSTPLTNLFFEQRRKYSGKETLGWHYRRAYAGADAGLDPLRFFSIAYSNNFVTVESLGVGGAGGEIRFNEGSVEQIFRCVREDSLGSYTSWAGDSHPVGGRPRLLRMDDAGQRAGQVRLEAQDLHPCRGALYFGGVAQESEQLGAFCRLEERVRALFSARAPTEAQRAESEARAATIVNQAPSHCFFPSSGYCFSCGADVTVGVTDVAQAAMATSCHVCGKSWCD